MPLYADPRHWVVSSRYLKSLDEKFSTCMLKFCDCGGVRVGKTSIIVSISALKKTYLHGDQGAPWLRCEIWIGIHTY